MRDVILKAAEHIEMHPDDYCFVSNELPEPGHRAGCALGWIAYHCGQLAPCDGLTTVTRWAASLLGVSGSSEFYDRMDTYNPGHKWGQTWTTNAQVCAQSLRAYADEFFPE